MTQNINACVCSKSTCTPAHGCTRQSTGHCCIVPLCPSGLQMVQELTISCWHVWRTAVQVCSSRCRGAPQGQAAGAAAHQDRDGPPHPAQGRPQPAAGAAAAAAAAIAAAAAQPPGQPERRIPSAAASRAAGRFGPGELAAACCTHLPMGPKGQQNPQASLARGCLDALSCPRMP